MKIHKTAIVHPNAKIAEGVEIGPYSIINENVSIGKNTVVGPHVVIDGWTEIGENNKIFQFASLGAISQDLKYHGEVAYLKIGNSNTIREYVTMNIGTEGGGGITQVGDNNLFMVGSHIAHDCVLGNNIIVANLGTLAGHIVVEDGAIIGGVVAIHQFSRIGQMSIIGGCSKVTQDIPPFMMADGHPAEVRGLNLIGLKRKEFSREAIHNIKEAHRILYRSNLNTSQAVEQIKNELGQTEEILTILNFIEKSNRGIAK
ncbi:MAG: acyl-ACP--UDP-N-acetylglucosamine O-acyltransferase [Candidatus Auribacterota bacterium]|jgi:UDP-N-acetylglucosamine acyltransferase|uniref:Acyl-[acyl-carrier-protein]--UDP-N-acetylglucosamine O-acyltransferase n=1 Tax=Candidatus Auribacter fodinae TaxID=2093366 RepID=A0A3A4QTC0_9BACT|nr:MAG: acyl-ACP--UDP-N-acetylglucosamine O-acyltransferase [Candidatus Auribacter fodinae]